METLGNHLGEPQIKLRGLQIWIQGRQFPDEQDYWDGNWLNVTAHCETYQASVWTNGPILHVSDLARWFADLETMNRTLSGAADLVSLEPELSVELEMNDLGHVGMRVEITPDIMTQEHSFEFEIDQSYLDGLIDNVRALLEKYPVRGRPDV
jgi:hypothetical protein